MGIQIDGRYKVENEVLNMALFGGHLCNGYINNDEFALARALLTHLTQELFSIHRFPGFEEFYRARYEYQMREAFSVLTSKDFELAKVELEELYEFTQRYLRVNFPDKEYLELKRSLNFPESEQVNNQLIDNEPLIKFESNIILSFSDYNWLGTYNSKVLLTKKVPFKDILIHYDALEFPHGTTRDIKENEVWVLNRDPLGKVQESSNSFQFGNLERNRNNQFLIKPYSEDFCSYTNAFNKHNKVWNDRWVQFVIKVRKKMGKIE